MVIKEKGNYILISKLDALINIAVGKLGTHSFLPGYYLYFGSAQSGLKQRVNRHLRSEKKCHWHIDYLLKYSRVIQVWGVVTLSRLECDFVRATLSIPGFRAPVLGFGSTDCQCFSHMLYSENVGNLSELPEQLEQLCGYQITPLWPLVTSDDR